MNLLSLGEAAIKGAATGSVVPGLGSALGAAGGIAIDLAPEVGQWLFGPHADKTVKAVQAAVVSVTGATEAAAQVAAVANPDVAKELRLQLAQIAAESANAASKSMQDQLSSQLADVSNARSTTIQLAQSGSTIAWGAPVVSIIVLLTFGAVMTAALTRTLPTNAEPVLNVLLGTLGAMATSVVSYWVGSSAGSARKDARLANLIKVPA